MLDTFFATITDIFGPILFFAIPIILILLSILVCAWVYKDAERHGKNGILWLIILIILNILGFILWLVLRNSYEKVAEKNSFTKQKNSFIFRVISILLGITPLLIWFISSLFFNKPFLILDLPFVLITFIVILLEFLILWRKKDVVCIVGIILNFHILFYSFIVWLFFTSIV